MNIGNSARMDLLLIAYAISLALAGGELISFAIWAFPRWFEWSAGLDRSYKERYLQTHRYQAVWCFASLIGGLFNLRGRCVHCGHQASGYRKIAVLDWLINRGLCAQCRRQTALTLVLPQIAVVPLTVLIVLAGGLTFHMLLALAAVWAWISIAFISLRAQLIPDALTYPLIWSFLAASTFGAGIDIDTAVLGAVFGYLVPWCTYHVIRKIFNVELFGHGIFKACAAIGAMAGPECAMVAFLCASLAKMGENKVRHGTLISASGMLPMGQWLAVPAIGIAILSLQG